MGGRNPQQALYFARPSGLIIFDYREFWGTCGTLGGYTRRFKLGRQAGQGVLYLVGFWTGFPLESVTMPSFGLLTSPLSIILIDWR
jgi:hypothetical protein